MASKSTGSAAAAVAIVPDGSGEGGGQDKNRQQHLSNRADTISARLIQK